MQAPKAYDATRAVFVGRRNLPHLRQEGAVYYVTFRLFDSVAGEKLREWQHELESLPKEQHKTHTARQMEKWLDLGHGSFAEMAGL